MLLLYRKPLTSPASKLATIDLFCFPVVKLSQILYNRNHTVCSLLSLASLTQHNVSKLLCISVVHSFLLLNNIPLYGYTTFCFPFAKCWIAGCFQFEVIINKATTNIHVQFCGFFFFLVKISCHFSWLNTQKWNCWPDEKYVLNFIRNC